jgi:hypothetical protein
MDRLGLNAGLAIIVLVTTTSGEHLRRLFVATQLTEPAAP